MPPKITLCQEEAFVDRRVPCPIGSETLKQLQEGLGSVQEKVVALQSAVEAHTTAALSGYPLDKDGRADTLGHRSYHEALIMQAKSRTDFWHKLGFELVKWGLIGFLFWVVTQLWASFILGPKK